MVVGFLRRRELGIELFDAVGTVGGVVLFFQGFENGVIVGEIEFVYVSLRLLGGGIMGHCEVVIFPFCVDLVL